MKPGITAALITRNESRCLGRCLDSMRSWVDEIVVVDTGSEDDTLEIARRYGARLATIEWPNDFAAARNASLELVETEWTLWMDADEWFQPGVGEAMRAATEREEAFAWELIRFDLWPNGNVTEAPLVRLWRTHPDMRMQGVIHEHIPPETALRAWPGKRVFRSDIGFLHDGYQGPASAEKLRRNLPLIEREMRERPGQLFYEIEWATTLKDLGDPRGEAAWESLIERVLSWEDLDVPPETSTAHLLVRILYALTPDQLRGERSDRLIRIARGWFGEEPSVLSMIAQTEIRRGNLHGAFDALRTLERLGQGAPLQRSTSARPDLMQRQLHTNLALVAHQLGRKDVARTHYMRLLELDPQNPVALQNLRLL